MSVNFPTGSDVRRALAAAHRALQTAHGDVAATIWPPCPPGSLEPGLARHLAFAALAAPSRTLAQRVATLEPITPKLVTDVRYLLADRLTDADLATVEWTQYERSSGPLKEARLGAYAAHIGLVDKPPAMPWSRYIAQLYLPRASPNARDRVLIDLICGEVLPDDAVKRFPDDFGIVWAAVKQHGYAIEHASER